MFDNKINNITDQEKNTIIVDNLTNNVINLNNNNHTNFSDNFHEFENNLVINTVSNNAEISNENQLNSVFNQTINPINSNFYIQSTIQSNTTLNANNSSNLQTIHNSNIVPIANQSNTNLNNNNSIASPIINPVLNPNANVCGLANKTICNTNNSISNNIFSTPNTLPTNSAPTISATCPPTNQNNIVNNNQGNITNSCIMNPNNNQINNIVPSSNVEIQDDDSEDESEILEESPCGRWLKRREEVEQRDIPGIDATFLAMDTEEGVEVVWNEVRFSERKYFNSKEENICEVFDRLILLNHPNIVKLHKYWMDKDVEKPRVIFITEYMSSGSLKLFLKKTKKNDVKMSLGAWKRWCTQILSALCYLHSAQPPIIHENLTCDSIFISHNGLIKIGAVAPNAIHQHIKTVADDTMSNIYLVAPEIANVTGEISSVLTPAVDIYSFGMCALEMAALEINENGESSQITKESIEKTIESLENELQKDFIRKCLLENQYERPTAKDLLFHPIVFEVPSLALLTAHAILSNSPSYQLTDEIFQRSYHNLNDEDILAEIIFNDGRPKIIRRICDIQKREVEKFFEEVRNGAYPLTAIFPTTKPPIITRQRTISPVPSGAGNENQNFIQENPYNEENRKIVNMMCNIKAQQENESLMMMTLLLRLDDKMNRQLSCEITEIESPICLANELVYYGFINQTDRDMVAALINDTISRTHYSKSENSSSVTLHQSTMTTV